MSLHSPYGPESFSDRPTDIHYELEGRGVEPEFVRLARKTRDIERCLQAAQQALRARDKKASSGNAISRIYNLVLADINKVRVDNLTTDLCQVNRVSESYDNYQGVVNGAEEFLSIYPRSALPQNLLPTERPE